MLVCGHRRSTAKNDRKDCIALDDSVFGPWNRLPAASRSARQSSRQLHTILVMELHRDAPRNVGTIVAGPGLALWNEIGGNHRQSARHCLNQWMRKGFRIRRTNVQVGSAIHQV